MGSFEYISVVISIVLGLAITHLLIGLVSMIQNRESTRVYWVHLLWVFNVIVYITQWWWAFHYWEKLDSWSMSDFNLLLIYSLMMAVIAGLLFPVHGFVTDYREFYYKQFRWFFALQFLWLSLDIVEVVVKASYGLRAIPPDYFLLTIPLILSFLAAVFVKNAKYHAFLVLLVFGWNFLYNVLVFVPIASS